MLATALKEWRRSSKGLRPTKTDTRPAQHGSMLTPLLFRDLDPEQRLSVLDLGAASGDTVAIFSEYRCRLNFVDLLAELDPHEFEADADPSLLQNKFEQLLGSDDAGPVDVILFWDTLNYLPPFQLSIFNDVLAGRMHDHSVGHAYSVRSTDVVLDWATYGFLDTSTVCSAEKPGTAPTYHPHPPSALNEAMPSLKVDRGVLLRDGRLEVMIRPVVAEE